LRILRYGPVGKERPAAIDEHNIVRDLGAVVPDINADALTPSALSRIREAMSDPDRLPPVDLDLHRVGPPVTRPGTIVCVGLNYADHARETGATPPEEPVLFLKATNTLVGPHDDVLIPPASTKLDWEVELAVIIGSPAYHVATDDQAKTHIAGYCLSHDVSERAFQMERGGQWTKGKSSPTFNPLGPWLVTTDELPDPQTVTLCTRVNGTATQDSSTAEMIFSPATLVRYISQFIALEPGDIINTGTPAGVGHGHRPPKYLQAGDVVEIGSNLLGSQRQTIRAASDGAA
jgi:2-keto-4-pentenoate hydratase/2-oxohepta-3-ene-1,7-dioic acid hydratase in catechol pathway